MPASLRPVPARRPQRPAPGPRGTARSRIEAVLEAAVHEFARAGWLGTSTETIAARAGISQPYLFRLFGSKKALFMAVVARAFARVVHDMRASLAHPGGLAPLLAMGHAYFRLIAEDRDILLVQLHGYAACADDDVREVVVRGFAEVVGLARSVEPDDDEVRHFLAVGMLANVSVAMAATDPASTVRALQVICPQDPALSAGAAVPPGAGSATHPLDTR